jgi:hypothetical protein
MQSLLGILLCTTLGVAWPGMTIDPRLALRDMALAQCIPLPAPQPPGGFCCNAGNCLVAPACVANTCCDPGRGGVPLGGNCGATPQCCVGDCFGGACCSACMPPDAGYQSGYCQCKLDGVACNPGQCCSGLCVGGSCVSGPSDCCSKQADCAPNLLCQNAQCCIQDNVAGCSIDTDCCTGDCDLGVCKPVNAACVPASQACGDNADCCNGVPCTRNACCLDAQKNGCPAVPCCANEVCVGGTCLGDLGFHCGVDADCKLHDCDQFTCKDPNAACALAPRGTCGDTADCCVERGVQDVCVSGTCLYGDGYDRCNNNDLNCANGDCDQNVCRPLNAACVNATNPCGDLWDCCVEKGVHDQCVANVCRYGDGYNGCTQNGDCANGDCDLGVCQAVNAACIPSQGACGDNADCCHSDRIPCNNNNVCCIFQSANQVGTCTQDQDCCVDPASGIQNVCNVATGKCLGGVGVNCRADADCGSNDCECQGSQCAAFGGFCGSATSCSGLGKACDPGLDCCAGTSCGWFSETLFGQQYSYTACCVPAGLTTACTKDLDCCQQPLGAACSSGTCCQLVQGSCGGTTGLSCCGTETCSGGKCLVPKGGNCTQDSDCVSAECDVQVTCPPHTLGNCYQCS